MMQPSLAYCSGQRAAQLDKTWEGLDCEGQLHFLR